MLRTAPLVPLAVKAACIRRIPTNRELAVAPAVDGDVMVPLAQAPELEPQQGGAVVVRPQGSPGAYLVAYTGTGYLALRAECPHEGCHVAWVPEDRQVECPCHGSRFAGDGTVLNPPARTNLTAYPAEPDGQGNVVVHLFAGDGTFQERVQNGQLRFPIAEFPVLANVGGAIEGRPTGFPTPLIVTRLTAGSNADAVAALSGVCTHLGCTVLPAGATTLQCPCHQSLFDHTGRFLQGPAGSSLFRYPVDFDGVTVTVSTG